MNLDTSFSPLLAAGDDGIAKFVFAVIFVAIWAISAIASALNKKAEQLKRQRTAEMLDPTRRVPMEPSLAESIRQKLPPVDVRPPKRTSGQGVLKPQDVRKSQGVQKRTPAPRKAPPPLPRVEQAILLEEEHTNRLVTPAVPAMPTGSPVPAASIQRPPAGVTAPAIRRWLTPATLRQQFILTELLQPPKALRADEYQW